MKKNGKKSFLDVFKVKDSEGNYDDDFFEEDDDYDDDEEEDYYTSRKPARKTDTSKSKGGYDSSRSTVKNSSQSYSTSSYQQNYASSYGGQNYKKAAKPATQQENNLLAFDNTQRRQNYKPSSEVYVIKPLEMDDAQTVSDFLRNGKTIVINMEGVQMDPGQRIIDFIGGACYGLGGDLKAISANIFIAAPVNIEISGDLREEILNESTLSPQLGKY